MSTLFTVAPHGLVAWLASAMCLAGVVASGLRWLRVAQREHYLPDATSRFALRWWSSSGVNLVAGIVALVGLALSVRWPAGAFGAGVISALGPARLSVRGRSSPLVWTRRLRTLTGVWVALEAALFVAGWLLGHPATGAAVGAVGAPAVVDLGCLLTAPLERRLAQRYICSARDRLEHIGPTVVGITGSYGKTSTKGYVAHLASSRFTVVASPASFNNRAGLARAVNEHLAPGTDVFVAEMGTYGPGEIAELCSWLRPRISVITAIGPVHLERFGSEDRIVVAKSEIIADAEVAVLNTDDDRLDALAHRAASEGKKVWRCSARDTKADVAVVPAAFEPTRSGSDDGSGDALEKDSEDGEGDAVERWDLYLQKERVAAGFSFSGQPGNLAVAVAVALELGVEPSDFVPRLSTVPGAPHRLEASIGASGAVVLDDTYNSNPAGCRAALRALAKSGIPDGRKVVVTPGMVELGARQHEQNASFAAAAAEVATDIVIVGRTNRRALREGAAGAKVAVVEVSSRQDAVAWVRQNLKEGDAVLYENDLPDHYP